MLAIRCVTGVLFSAAVINGSAPALAQVRSTGPESERSAKPIRIIHPFPPGGATDSITRILQPRLSDALGQPVILDYRPGAAGSLSAEYVARSAPDGNTLLMGFSTVLTINKSLYSKLGFDPLRDFAPILQLATAQYFLIVHPSVPARTANELVALARARPGSLNYASAGIGSPLHLAAELFKSYKGIDMVHVAYKGGGPAAIAVLSGESHVVFGSVAASQQHVQTGRLRALAVTGIKRSTLAPQLPTLDESGFPGFNVTTWQSLLAPAGTPREIVQRVHDETIKALRLPDVRTLIASTGFEPTGTTAEQLLEIIRSESAMWAKVIKQADIRAD